jgi:hypothetical protein
MGAAGLCGTLLSKEPDSLELGKFACAARALASWQVRRVYKYVGNSFELNSATWPSSAPAIVYDEAPVP